MISVTHIPAGTCCKHQGFLNAKLAPPPVSWNLSETCILGLAASQPTVDSDPVRTMQPASDPTVGLPHAGRSSAGFHKSGWKKFRVTRIPNTRKATLLWGPKYGRVSSVNCKTSHFLNIGMKKSMETTVLIT